MNSDNDNFVWPERINVSKTITYDVQILRDQMEKDFDRPINFDDVLEMIQDFAKDDFSCGWGHQENVKYLIFTDENGEEY